MLRGAAGRERPSAASAGTPARLPTGAAACRRRRSEARARAISVLRRRGGRLRAFRASVSRPERCWPERGCRVPPTGSVFARARRAGRHPRDKKLSDGSKRSAGPRPPRCSIAHAVPATSEAAAGRARRLPRSIREAGAGGRRREGRRTRQVAGAGGAGGGGAPLRHRGGAARRRPSQPSARVRAASGARAARRAGRGRAARDERLHSSAAPPYAAARLRATPAARRRPAPPARRLADGEAAGRGDRTPSPPAAASPPTAARPGGDQAAAGGAGCLAAPTPRRLADRLGLGLAVTAAARSSPPPWRPRERLSARGCPSACAARQSVARARLHLAPRSSRRPPRRASPPGRARAAALRQQPSPPSRRRKARASACAGRRCLRRRSAAAGSASPRPARRPGRRARAQPPPPPPPRGSLLRLGRGGARRLGLAERGACAAAFSPLRPPQRRALSASPRLGGAAALASWRVLLSSAPRRGTRAADAAEVDVLGGAARASSGPRRARAARRRARRTRRRVRARITFAPPRRAPLRRAAARRAASISPPSPPRSPQRALSLRRRQLALGVLRLLRSARLKHRPSHRSAPRARIALGAAFPSHRAAGRSRARRARASA